MKPCCETLKAPPASDKIGSLSVCVLASGSKGNAIHVSDGRTAILVDAGLSGIEIQRRMAAADLSIADLSAIVVSHEHSDHVRGVGVLARRYGLPVHLSPGTEEAARGAIGHIPEISHFRIGRRFAIGDLRIHPFATSHDARDPGGFTIAVNGCKIGIATDLGIATGMVRQHLAGCALLVIEANHDPRMLLEGPYPWPLKQRIKGRDGHLSNQDAGRLLTELAHDALRHVILAHLSEINNTPDKARATVERTLETVACRFRLHVARQDCCSEVLTVAPGRVG
ncbi:MBL fold metallo-hydrolase [Desulfatitalea alkaliphila]|uniref:MBL fold metallo-hydrolase n=1 Tax=Desulfatitalea alkaliphila TaxID=2929485 RepID=A0AA41R522_9BACT|nr:MBL fold metallo-hydrolase [Desulfatitalea alkaliphila]MCJ8501160.1 MBL fold metallo-hydrolase [Desulfatitalea alkaliphila]